MPTNAPLQALAFHAAHDDPAAWAAALRAELPDLELRVSPDLGDLAEIGYALVWQPPAGFFAGMTKLRLVVNLGAGVDALVSRDDLPDVPIARLSDPGMVGLMTSYVLHAVLRHAREVPALQAAQRRGEWLYIHPRPLAEITVGVLGLGELGAAAARALAGLGFTVGGWSRSAKAVPGVACTHGEAALDGFLSTHEIVVVMLPLTPETRGLLDAARLARLPRGAAFINVARGRIVDEEALVAALRSGALGGATLDVFAVEPLPAGHPLWAMDNVLVTPHHASIATPRGAAPAVAEAIRRVAEGRAPLNGVERGRGY